MVNRTGACYIMASMLTPDPKYPELRRRRFRPIPVRMLVPNVITLLAICAGLTAIRLSIEGRMELAVAAIVFAAILAVLLASRIPMFIERARARRQRGTSRSPGASATRT